MEAEERLLIERAQKGDRASFEALVKKYDKQVLSLAYNLINDTEDAKDIYQEVFLRIYKSIDKFRFESNFFTWIYRIVVNYCINYRSRRHRRRHYSLNGLLEDTDEFWRVLCEDDSDNPEKQLLRRELDMQISQALEKLSPKQRAVFILRHYHGFKLNQVAEILQCSDGTVKNYLFRANQKLKKSLQEYMELD